MTSAARAEPELESGGEEPGAVPRQLREMSDWLLEALGAMSGAETVALAGIIAAALLFCWRAAR